MRTRSGKGNAEQKITAIHTRDLQESPTPESSRESDRLSNHSSPSKISSPGKEPDGVMAYYQKPVLTISGIPEKMGRKMQADDLERGFKGPPDPDESLTSDEDSVNGDESAEAFNPSGKRTGRGGRGGGRGRGSGRGRGRGRGSRGGRGRGGARGAKAQQMATMLHHEDVKAWSHALTPALDSPLPDSASTSQDNYQPQPNDRIDTAEALREESPSEQLINETVTAVKSTTESKAPSISKSMEPNAKPTYIDEELTDDDLPPPFASTNGSFEDTDIEDQADLIMRQRFQPMTDPQKFIAALTKHAPAERTTEILYAIAENTQRALQEWQDEYLEIDKRVAAHANNGPRKPVTGGRLPVDPKVFEDMKEADLYSYTYDHRKAPGKQDPWNQRVGTEYVGGRELRHRRARDVTTDDLAGSEEEASGKRRRKAVQRFDAMPDAASLARKREIAPSETPEPQALPRKKGKLGSGKKIGQYVPQRIQEIARDESIITTSASEEDDGDIYEAAPEPKYKRRGRPPGSKNHTQRKDAGIKKGPRTKKTTEAQQQGAQDSDAQPRYSTSTMPSATPPAIAPAYQQPAQNQPFHVQGYTHAPPTNIPPAPLAPVMNIDRSFAIANRAPVMHPFTPPQNEYPAGSYPNNPAPTNMIQPTATNPVPLAPSPPDGPSPTSRPSSAGKKKPVKSEKRSASMTQWWADRKAKQAEERQREARNQPPVIQHPQMAVGSAYGNANGYTGPYPQPGYAAAPFSGAQPAQNAYRPIAPSGLHQNHASPHLQPQPQPLQHHGHHLPQQHQHPSPLQHPSQGSNHNAGAMPLPPLQPQPPQAHQPPQEHADTDHEQQWQSLTARERARKKAKRSSTQNWVDESQRPSSGYSPFENNI